MKKLNPREFAELLLSIKAVTISFNPHYTWSSGWKSPIYCDNRKILSYIDKRLATAESLAVLVTQMIEESGADRSKVTLAGVATAGIAVGGIVAHMLGLSFVYVRPTPKGHGLQKQIEGVILGGHKVIIIEDLVSTGKSSLQVVDVVRNEGGVEVLGMCALFTYGFPQATAAFDEHNVLLKTLSHGDALTSQAIENGIIETSDSELFMEWRKAPHLWRQEKVS